MTTQRWEELNPEATPAERYHSPSSRGDTLRTEDAHAIVSIYTIVSIVQTRVSRGQRGARVHTGAEDGFGVVPYRGVVLVSRYSVSNRCLFRGT